jgi:hypothetical protein
MHLMAMTSAMREPGKKGDMETATPDVIEKNLQFAYNVCKDNNAYTATEEFWNIVKSGSDDLLEDRDYVRSVFPSLTWK